jgi:serine/threonine-protein kinase
VVDVVAILRQLATGLAAAHRARIVDRDLKPANVMLTRDGHLKILDFGLAKATLHEHETVTALTAPRTTVGTVAYMAPEQAEGAEVDAGADVWSWGVIGYEMLTGRLPFQSESATAALPSLMRDTPLPVRDVQPSVPVEIAALIDRASEKVARSADRDGRCNRRRALGLAGSRV